jgi:malonate transporter
MATIVGIVFPIFALIGLGYLGRRLGLLAEDAAAILSGYVYYFSLPALLYVKVAEVPVGEFFSGNLIFAYSGGILTASLLIWTVGRLRGMDRRYIGMFILNATFGNVGYMGVPFNTVAFGERGIPVVALTIVLTLTITTVLSVTLGLAVIEGGRSKAGGWRGLMTSLFPGRFLSNPVLLSIAAGSLASLFAIRLPEPVQKFLGLLADTAGPVALFAIGTFLHATPVLRGFREVMVLAGVKLVALPLLTLAWFTWLPVERVPFAIAVLQSAMPVAATNFIFSQQFGVAVEVTAAGIVVSTVLSLLTLSALLFLLL